MSEICSWLFTTGNRFKGQKYFTNASKRFVESGDRSSVSHFPSLCVGVVVYAPVREGCPCPFREKGNAVHHEAQIALPVGKEMDKNKSERKEGREGRR